MIIATVVAINQASPVSRKSRRTAKRDIGLKLREEARLLKHHSAEHTEDHTVVYGNGIPGHEAEIIHQEFNRDDYGNYNFA